MSTLQSHLLTPSPALECPALNHDYRGGLYYFITRLFGCQHRRLSRPFTQGRETYVTCLNCGLRRSFDLQNWKPTGRYYSPRIEGHTTVSRSGNLQSIRRIKCATSMQKV